MRVAAMAIALAFGLGQTARAQDGIVIPRLVEETATSGIGNVYAGEWQYMVGGGAAAFDCDGDGFPDVFLAGGAGPAKFYRNNSAQSGPLRFAEQASGLELEGVTGAYPIDIDGDGKVDVVLLRVGGNVLMRGLGGCRFERANELWGFDGGDGWTTSFSATWERGANWPTLAFGNYIDRAQEDFPWGSCTDNMLYRPDGDRRRFAAPVALKPSHCALSMLFTDWNRSGTPSLRISNDREYYKGGEEQLWHVDPGLPPALYTEEEGWKSLRIWGMGIASYDLKGTGYPDYFLTSMADNKLQTLAVIPPGGRPKPDFNDVAWASGVTAQRPYAGGDVKPSTAWHAQFEDFNNDGLADLFIVKGNVAKMKDFAARDPNNLLLQGQDGKFFEAGEAAGIASFATGRGAAIADFNLDGLVDVIVSNRWEGAKTWRNVTPGAGRWVQFQLRQPGPNRDAIGAWLEVRAGGRVARREIAVGGGHAGGSLGWRHFGVGEAAAVEVRVIWPGGDVGEWQAAATNTLHVLERGRPPAAWTPEAGRR